MWGIGKQMEAKLNAMGIQTVGGLANQLVNNLRTQTNKRIKNRRH